MDYDKKVFWRYIYYEELHPKNWIKNSVFYEYFMMFIIIYVVLFTDINLRGKAIIFLLFLAGITIMKFYTSYKSGFHRHWNRIRYGIPSKSDIKRMKKEREKNLPEKEVGISKLEDKSPL